MSTKRKVIKCAVKWVIFRREWDRSGARYWAEWEYCGGLAHAQQRLKYFQRYPEDCLLYRIGKVTEEVYK